ncbi:MAG: heterodisulfide reductase-related iron-sulfur binding cluster [Pseudomonadota bacterium]
MDQQELRDLESRCIQEQPPECLAACPLHVDARALCAAIRDGRWDDAWKTLHKTMPFPGILGRICDAPCRARCKRGQAGEPLDLGGLEKACVSHPAPRQRLLPLPSKGKRVVVVGSGLSGLTVAWDLARKGVKVEIHEPGPTLGGRLAEFIPRRLSRDVIDREIAVLARLGVEIKPQVDAAAPDYPKKALAGFDAVYLSLDSGPVSLAWGLETDDRGRLLIEPFLQTASLAKVFAGGAADSPVFQAAEGRWAASSIDRFLQNVSLTAGRDKDGPLATRLFTNLRGIPPLPAVLPADPARGYDDEEASREAARCLNCECRECVKICRYLESFGAYPKKYAREIYNNESIVMGSHQANRLINSCSLCGLCREVCPEGFDMPGLCLESRQGMVDRGKMPPSAHEFALLDLEFSRSDRFALVRNEPGASPSRHAFFPGCQLAASSPDLTARVYDHLRGALPGGVGLILGCCGAPAHWAGQKDLFLTILEERRQAWEDLGRPLIIQACSTCLQLTREFLPDVEAVSLWSALNTMGFEPPRGGGPRPPVAIHDPCTARKAPEIGAGVRGLAARLGLEVRELELSGERTECCGFGGLMQNAAPGLAREVIKKRAGQSGLDYLTYCAMCRDNLAGVGKRAIHLLDLLFPSEIKSDPADRPRPGWSERQENRTRLREKLLWEIWGEKEDRMEEHQGIGLVISPDVRELLEERRILLEDVQKVILNAETTGDRLLHPETGRRKAAFTPYKATFWVEYTPSPDGYIIHNAYTHRMRVVGGGRL